MRASIGAIVVRESRIIDAPFGSSMSRSIIMPICSVPTASGTTNDILMPRGTRMQPAGDVASMICGVSTCITASIN